MRTSLPRAYAPVRSESAGLFVVLEGPSAIGKSTLTEAVRARLDGTSLHTLPAPHTDWSSRANTVLRAMPQFAFYLSGLLHTSDEVRRLRATSPVVADRYVSSVIACHSAVHGVGIRKIEELLKPYANYLEIPHTTFYLRCAPATLYDRMTSKKAAGALTADDRELSTVPGRLADLLDRFDKVAADDPTAVVLDTDGKTVDDLVKHIAGYLEGVRAADQPD